MCTEDFFEKYIEFSKQFKFSFLFRLWAKHFASLAKKFRWAGQNCILRSRRKFSREFFLRKFLFSAFFGPRGTSFACQRNFLGTVVKVPFHVSRERFEDERFFCWKKKFSRSLFADFENTFRPFGKLLFGGTVKIAFQVSRECLYDERCSWGKNLFYQVLKAVYGVFANSEQHSPLSRRKSKGGYFNTAFYVLKLSEFVRNDLSLLSKSF